MSFKIHTYIFLTLLSLSLAKIPEISLNNLDGSVFFVQVYEDGCANCQSEEKELDDVAALLNGFVKVGKVNMKSIPAMKGQKLPKNPSYFMVKGGIQEFQEYKDKISRISIAKFVLAELEKLVKARDAKLHGKKPNTEGAKDKKQQSKTGKPNKGGASAEKDGSGVTILNDNNFEATVLGSDEAWFVEFYSPSCGHCVALQPEWDKLPSKIGKRVRIAKIDATQNRQTAQKYQIKGFPTLLLFGQQDKQTPIPYTSQRTAQSMVSWLQTQKIPEQKLQFTKLSQQSYSKQCNRNIVCLIFILEKKSELKDIDFVEDLMEENKGKPLRFFYSQKLPKFEQEIMIQDRSTPKLVSIWDTLNSYKVYNSGINQADLQLYINKIMERKSWIKLSTKPADLIFGEQNGSKSEQL